MASRSERTEFERGAGVVSEKSVELLFVSSPGSSMRRAARSDRAAQGHAGDQRGGGSTGGGPVVRHQEAVGAEVAPGDAVGEPGLTQVADGTTGLDRVQIQVDVEVLAAGPDAAVREQDCVLAAAIGHVGEGGESGRARAGGVAPNQLGPIAEEALEVEIHLDLDVAAVRRAGARGDLADLHQVEGCAGARGHRSEPHEGESDSRDEFPPTAHRISDASSCTSSSPSRGWAASSCASCTSSWPLQCRRPSRSAPSSCCAGWGR